MSVALYAKCGQCGAVNRFDIEKKERPLCGKCSARLDPTEATPGKPISISDATFPDQVLGASVPVLVDFFAPWCGACRTLDPALEIIASRYKGRLKVARLDIDQNPENARKYQIRATPTLIVFRNGRVAEQTTGALPETRLQEFVEKHVS